MRPQGGVIERPLHPQGPAERLAPHREVQARDRGVDVRPTPACRAARIGRQNLSALVPDRDDADQLGLDGSFAAPDAGAHGLRALPSSTGL